MSYNGERRHQVLFCNIIPGIVWIQVQVWIENPDINITFLTKVSKKKKNLSEKTWS